MSPSKPKGRCFTEAARAAAIEARRRKAQVAVSREAPEVYVVRQPDAHLRFGWEIRRFGSLVLDKSRTEYVTVQDARFAGENVLGSR